MNAVPKSPFFWSDYRFDSLPARKVRFRLQGRGWVWKTALGMVLGTILMPLVLRWVAPPTSAFMLKSSLARSAVRYRWVPMQAISRHLPVAVVAAEDQKFMHHWGFDFESIGSAMEENKRRQRPRGASTISQQVAKNLFLWSGRSYIRKGFEAYFTVLIELLWPKRRIMEVYLNIAEFGPGIFGVEAASRAYFNKPAGRLERDEAALLAAVLPNPRRLKAAAPSEYVRQRVLEIEEQMKQLGGPVYLKGIWPEG